MARMLLVNRLANSNLFVTEGGKKEGDEKKRETRLLLSPGGGGGGKTFSGSRKISPDRGPRAREIQIYSNGI